ncbi:ABC transporter permease [Sneathiella chinensis]|uniref:ABC transporter permease n=1 Tax=Sneathiella chinensis TaxID=349750 RepID=A0ABQ5U4S7_9PROT|nr:ABC transporter permease [Sneathiella chinensis]GLQ06205.1 ABC transporter permease [Sneathiella chinensis]
MELFQIIILLLDATFRVATPLVLAAMAGMFSERSGVVDIGLEGKMLGAAFAAAAASSAAGSAWLGLCAGVVTSLALSSLHAYACVTHKGNQVVSGMAINIMVSGLTPTLAIAWFHQGGQTPSLSGDARFQPITLPFADAVREIPVIGYTYAELISGHNILVYCAAASVPLVAYILYKTRFGLRVRAVGENPHAVDTAGISVELMRYKALAVTGILCGFAGSYLSTAHGAGFIREMTAGKGYLALAALIFGKWKPVPTLFACLLFAFTDAVQARLQGVELPIVGVIPVQFIQALPYILTVLLLAGFVGKANPPKSIGVPYIKER